MRAVLGLCAVAAFAGCNEPPTPAPELLAVSPAQATSDREVPVAISGAHLAALVVTDFVHHGKSALDSAFSARLTARGGDGGEGVALVDVRLAGSSALEATVPAGVPRGEYDLLVVDPAGRSLRLESAYRVVASAETVAGFRIDPIGPQRVGSPFTVSLAAVDGLGRVVDGFTGAATLADATGTLGPTDSGPFALGRARVMVVVATPSAADSLTVTDGLGHASSSEPFEVKTGLPVALAVRSPAQTVDAGECSSPWEIALEDGAGEVAVAEGPLTLELAAGPLDAVTFFSDATCGTPSPTIVLDAGESLASVFFRTPRSGHPTLRVSSAVLPSVGQTQTVTPGPPSHLAFSTPGQSVAPGQCSPALVVEAFDGYGNPSPVPADLPLSPSLSPTGAGLHPDPACTTSLTQLVIAAGTSSASFYFEASSSGALTIELTGPLGGAAQEETIAP